MGEVPHLDSNVYLFSKRRKDQTSLKKHRLQSAYLQPLLVQWDLHTTNFYHNEVFPPVTVKNIENNQDKRNPVNPFVILGYHCIQRVQEASIIQKYACIFLIYLENEQEKPVNQSTPWNEREREPYPNVALSDQRKMVLKGCLASLYMHYHFGCPM